MAVDDPFDTSDMATARHHLRRLLSDWRDAGGDVDPLVHFIEGFVACKVSEMMQQREAYLAQETVAGCEHQYESTGNFSPRQCVNCLAYEPR